MKGYEFISSKKQCVCSVRITTHARERLAVALQETKEINLRRARGFLGRATLLELSEVRALGYRPRAIGRLEEGNTSHYLHIQERGQEALAVLTDDPGDGKLVWVTTYSRDPVTDVRRTIRRLRMGRTACKNFLNRKKGEK